MMIEKLNRNGGLLGRPVEAVIMDPRSDTGAYAAQARALLRISRQAGMRQIDLAEQMENQPITLARLIDQLEKAGHVERRPDPDDRRAYRLHLTRKAAAPLAAINKVAAEVQLAAMKNLDKAEVEALFRAMEKMRGNLSERF